MEVDALANTYGGGPGQTTMNVPDSSSHPQIAGLQSTLAEVLLEYGAKTDGLDQDGSPIHTALAFGYLSAAEALVNRNALIGEITVAASRNRLYLVKEFVEGRMPEPRESLLRLYWSGVPRDRVVRQRVALLWGCSFGAIDVVRYFLEIGMDPANVDDNKMAALHTALRCAIEAQRWHPERIPHFVECVEALVGAGAGLVRVDYVTGIDVIDAVLEQHRTRPQA